MLDDSTMKKYHDNGDFQHFKNWLIPKLNDNEQRSLDFERAVLQNLDKIYKFYHRDDSKCYLCGRPYSRFTFISGEDRPLLTNVLPVCSKCNLPIRLPFTTICKEFSFEAAHRLLDYDGLCSRWHGHSYKLQVFVRKPINPRTDMVMDFSDLKKAVNVFILDILDHSCLNNVLEDLNTTSETLLLWIWNQLEKGALLKGLVKLRLWETSTSFAELRDVDLVGPDSIYLASYLSDSKLLC